MLYRLVRPMKRKGSSYPQFVKRIPLDLRDPMSGMSLCIPLGDDVVSVTVSAKTQAIRFSLRTSDPSEVKDRQASAISYLERLFVSLRSNAPLPLTHRNAVALSGEVYRAWSSDLDTGQRLALVQTEDGWVREDSFDADERKAEYEAAIRYLDRLEDTDDPSVLEAHFDPIIKRLLGSKGVPLIDEGSWQMVREEFLKALHDGFQTARKKAGSDYSPDLTGLRFPDWSAPEGIETDASVSLKGLAEGWWKEAKSGGLSPSTYEGYRKALHSLADFLKHDDASRISEEDVIRFKDELLTKTNPRNGKPLSAKTVKDGYISALRSVFAWAVTNKKMQFNPAIGVKITRPRKVRLRDSWFSPDEIRAILEASKKVKQGKKEPPQRYAMKRWVPWLCAYSGARVGEIVQLRKKDFRQDNGSWLFTITPEAGTVKGKEQREVPLHPDFIAQGFEKFLDAASEGHLFMWSGDDRGAWRNAKNRLTEFIRTVVQDPNVSPNHAWRHTFKTIGSEAGIQDKVLDAICGHAPRTIGETYGGVTLAAKVLAMSMYPAYFFEQTN